ncbi:MAG TPA: hypothetical protein VGQ77_13445, partial [Methylomirabilota bacterium]|nr:hypothetical protein [Methylomirabilota bacterium]
FSMRFEPWNRRAIRRDGGHQLVSGLTGSRADPRMMSLVRKYGETSMPRDVLPREATAHALTQIRTPGPNPARYLPR